MTVHHPQDPQSQGGVTPPAATPGTTGAGQHSAAPQEPIITSTTTPGSGQSQGTKQAAKDEAANVAGTAKDQAANVAGTAKEAGRHVADTAKGEARQVVGEAKQQARQLLDQSVEELKSQAKSQQERTAGGVRTFSDDLRKMANGEGGGDGFAAQIANEVSDRASTAAQWLQDREPADLLEEVKRFARRRPGTFIAIAGVTGLLVGRLARSIASEAKDERDRENAASTGTYGTYSTGAYGSGYGADTYSTDTYGTGAAGAYGTGAAGVYGADATGAYGTGAATPVDNEPWLGERPAADIPAVDPDLPFSGDPNRRETGL